MINKRISKLRALMQQYNIDVYVIPTADYHQSEYLADYFKTRQYMSNFTGSQGTMVISLDNAGLWVDGRYHVQAEKEIKDTEIELFKVGLANVASVNDIVEKWLKDKGTIGFDGKTMSTKVGNELYEIASKKKGVVLSDYDLVGMIWEERGEMPKNPIFILDEKYVGLSIDDKLLSLRQTMSRKKVDTHVLCALDEICWLLNIRGNDIKHTPVVLSYVIITEEDATLYIDFKKVSDEIKTELNRSKITLKEYNSFIEDCKNIKDRKIWLDEEKCHYSLVSILSEKNEILNEMSSIVMAKACKNEVEIENIKRVHELDGVAFLRFIIWLEDNYKSNTVTEMSAAKKLEELRYEMGAIDLSFSTISAFNEHGAMMHYSSSSETDTVLNNGIYLIDSGGQYIAGTTDITRTFALGDVDDKYKLYYTSVLKSNMQLARANFLYGCSGLNLDVLARQPIWDLNLDYQSGTGHGIGHLLGVHEGPQGFRWYISPLRKEDTVLENGMIITDEPGLYFEGEFGIRIENELLVRKATENYYGQFMKFEVITYAPIDTKLIDISLLTQQEKDQINNYHKLVFDKLSTYLNEGELKALKTLTQKI